MSEQTVQCNIPCPICDVIFILKGQPYNGSITVPTDHPINAHIRTHTPFDLSNMDDRSPITGDIADE